jgi:hypothetical protein
LVAKENLPWNDFPYVELFGLLIPTSTVGEESTHGVTSLLLFGKRVKASTDEENKIKNNVSNI